ncbi:hypothetical protein [Paenibacillus wynnii]|uniref:hypothetical protein n=1 Tax=Paenibacillus wynnii TaxID=268407 RepID=UPI002793FDE6|nr:hypothetical protein [Paenibacillus wynnii]MDQ0195362.1 hypothetical protein [Paenibacillus wynnii]
MKFLVNGFNKLGNYLLGKWYRIMILIIVIIILLPITTNYLMFLKVPYFPTENNNNWIGFFGSFFGSIIGGLLTLIGIYLTIKRDNYEKIISGFGIKVRKIDEVQNLLDSFKEELCEIEEPNDHVDFVTRYQEVLPKVVIRGLRDIKILASEVNAELYNEITCLHDELVNIFFQYTEKVNHEVFHDDSFATDIVKSEQNFKEIYAKEHPHFWFDALDIILNYQNNIVGIRDNLEEEYWEAYVLLGNIRKKKKIITRE